VAVEEEETFIFNFKLASYNLIEKKKMFKKAA
jgi:hypothetical protein